VFKNNHFTENVQRFRGGLVFKAHRSLYHSTLGLRVIKPKAERRGVYPVSIVFEDVLVVPLLHFNGPAARPVRL